MPVNIDNKSSADGSAVQRDLMDRGICGRDNNEGKNGKEGEGEGECAMFTWMRAAVSCLSRWRPANWCYLGPTTRAESTIEAADPSLRRQPAPAS